MLICQVRSAIQNPMIRCVIVVFLDLLASVAAHAEDASHWQFNITPYVWFGGLHSTFSRALAPGVPPLQGKSDVPVLLPYAEHLPAMIAGEVRYGRFGLGIDFNALDANFGFSLRTPPFLAGNADTDNFQTTVIASYRVVQADQQHVDIGVGARIWSVHSTLTLGRLSSESKTRWTDPLLAVRYHLNLPENFGLTLYGDIGGVHIGSALTYEIAATVDFALTNWMVQRAGYRYAFFDYRSSNLNRSATLNGPIIGTTFRF